MLPSEVEGAAGEKSKKAWKAQMIDIGEVVT